MNLPVAVSFCAICGIIATVRRRHRRTLQAIFARPTPAGIRWDEVESLLLACGAYVEERAGSRVGVVLNGVKLSLHRPHPGRELRKAAVESLRDFFEGVGITP